MKKNSKPPIFLVGCPRSGTTLLQSLLATHPQIASFRETKFFQYLIPSASEPKRQALGFVSRQLKPRLEVYFRDELVHPELLNELPKLPFMKNYTRKFFQILQDLTAKQGKSILLEKTPQHIYAIESIEKFLPGVKFIHLVRNGADVVASLYEVTHRYPEAWGGKPWEIDLCLDWWKRAVEVSLKSLSKPNHIVVSYEQLVTEPQIVLSRLCEFIGVEFDEKMLKNYGRVAQEMSLDQEGRSVNLSLKNLNATKFYQVFDTNQQNYILSQVAQVKLEPFLLS